MDKPWTTEPDTDKPSENLPSWGPLDRNPAYDGPMGIFEGYGGAKRGTLLKRDCMAHAWARVLRPYLLGLRDWTKLQARPDPWHDLTSAPEDEWVLLATTGGWVGEALMLRDQETGEQRWQWVSGNKLNSKLTPLKWMPLPEHPDAALSRAGASS